MGYLQFLEPTGIVLRCRPGGAVGYRDEPQFSPARRGAYAVDLHDSRPYGCPAMQELCHIVVKEDTVEGKRR